MKRILFIDDEINVLRSIHRSLNLWFKENQIEPHMSESAKDALSYIRDHGKEIAVIVTDQKMPGLRGNEVIGLIKDKHPDIVSIILSGHSDMKDMENIIKTDIYTFLHKPWNTEQLKSEILKALNLNKMQTENSNLKERIKKELLLAGEFQHTIMSNSLKQDISVPITVTYKPSPSTGISGDYYEIIPITHKQIVILLGDVSGHGIKPAFITMALKSIIRYEFFRSATNKAFDTKIFTSWLNKRLYTLIQAFPDLFLTHTCLYLDLTERLCTLTNAGQPNPVVITDNGIKEIVNRNIVLGVDPDAKYSQESFPLTEDTRIFLCSDGIHPVGNEKSSYTEENFKELIAEYKDKLWDHKSIISRIEKDFLQEKVDDDLTIININLTKENLCVE